MALQLGDIILSDDDTPDAIPLGGQLASRTIDLSDGSRLLSITGDTPHDIRLQGTLRYRDANGTPLEKIARLERMRDAHTAVRLGGTGFSELVLVTDVAYSIIRHNEVQYDVLLFREVAGSLGASAGSGPATGRAGVSATIHELAALQIPASPALAAALGVSVQALRATQGSP